MIAVDMLVTIEAGAFDYNAHIGERARVLKIVGPFAILEMDCGPRSVLVNCLQPVMTASAMFARLTERAQET